MKISKYMILGGGMVAGHAAKEFVARGLKRGDLTIVSSDSSIPYERPPLSKGFLAGKDSEQDIQINSGKFYSDNDIALTLNVKVTQVDTVRRVLHLESGDDMGFDKLIVATGARPKTLEIPGNKLSGVYYLRSLEDSKRIRTGAESAKRAVVIGGGFIGMEVASVLAQKGVSTTMLLREDRIWKQFFTPAMSQFFESYYTARGVQLVKSANLAELRGDGAVSSVVLDTKQSLESDMVVAGIGVIPVTEPVANSGIEIANGIVVNEYLETNRRGIYAAGDVANYQDALYKKRRRVEHWDNAVSQGQHCARLLLGERARFIHVPYFFSDVFDLSYEFWGDPAGADEVVERGDLSTNSFSVWWLQRETVVAAFAMNRPDEEREVAPKWIAEKQHVSAERLRAKGSVHSAV